MDEARPTVLTPHGKIPPKLLEVIDILDSETAGF